LASHSGYFRNLCFEDWKERKQVASNSENNTTIHPIKEGADIDVTAFTFMLNAMHVLGSMLHKIPFPRWKENDLQTKVAMLKLAIKYQLPICVTYAENALIDLGTDHIELLELADNEALDRLKVLINNAKNA
jgi:hypothetical protein